MSGAQTKPWYETRKSLRRGSPLYATVQALDVELRWQAENIGAEVCNPPYVYTSPKTDFGRVTWSSGYRNYRTLSPQYMCPDHFPDREVVEGYVLPASNISIPTFPEDAIPAHVAHMLDVAAIDEIDDGFELFGGLKHDTCVYFLEGRLSGLIKIGIASHLKNRVASIQSGSPEPLSLVCHLPANRYFEQFMHALFEPLRHHGEWFYPHWSINSVVMGLNG